MASKTSMLKNGAKKTGTGLFAGMSPIKDAEAFIQPTENKENVHNASTVQPIKQAENVQADEPVRQTASEPHDRQMQTVSEPQTVQTQAAPAPHIEQTQSTSISHTEHTQSTSQAAPEHVSQPESVSQPEPASQAAAQLLSQKEPEAKPQTASKASKNSRYEKEKFLLLDIRGLRDYVEHMAKAANMSATKYIRNLIELDMQQNMDIYEAHKALEEKLKGRR